MKWLECGAAPSYHLPALVSQPAMRHQTDRSRGESLPSPRDPVCTPSASCVVVLQDSQCTTENFAAAWSVFRRGWPRHCDGLAGVAQRDASCQGLPGHPRPGLAHGGRTWLYNYDRVSTTNTSQIWIWDALWEEAMSSAAAHLARTPSPVVRPPFEQAQTDCQLRSRTRPRAGRPVVVGGMARSIDRRHGILTSQPALFGQYYVLVLATQWYSS